MTLFCSVLFCSVLFCSVLFCSVLFCSVLFCSVLFCSVLFCSVLFCSVLFCSVRLKPNMNGWMNFEKIWNCIKAACCRRFRTLTYVDCLFVCFCLVDQFVNLLNF